MKHRFISLLCALIAFALHTYATQYCETAVTLTNPNYAGNSCDFKLTCQKDGDNYVVEAEITSAGQTFNYSGYNASQPWKKGDANYYNISSYILTSNGNKTVTITFPWEPQFTANGQKIPLLAVNGFACAMPTDVEWGMCSAAPDVPIMRSASKASATETSITLNVEAVVNGGANTVTQFMVAVDGTTPTLYTATAGQITIPGLLASREYTITVRAYYNGNTSENEKTVIVSTNKASECEGRRGHFANPALAKVDFEIGYDDATNTITWTLTETEGRNLTFAKIEWDVPGVGSGAATSDNGNPTYLVTLNGSTATYSFQAPNNYIGQPMGIMFLFDAAGVTGRSQTAESKSLTDPNVIYYIVGACGCAADDGANPVMGSVSVFSTTASSVTLNVAATDNSGPVTTFLVNGKKYNAFGGQITVEGLSMCTDYTLDVYAIDASCRQSTNSTPVSFKTLFDSNYDILESAYAEFGYEGNAQNRGDKCIDGEFGTRGGTQNGSLEQAWLTIDLASVQPFNRIDIYWEDAIPGSAGYDIEVSLDGTHFTQIGHYGQPANHTNTTPTKGNPNHYTRHNFANTQARYIRVKALSLYRDDWGISIWEIEVYNVGATECPEEPECPQIVNAYVQATTTTTATLNISVVDMQTPNPDDLEYDIRVVCSPDNLQYTNPYYFAVGEHSNGLINIEGLVPGAPYDVTVKIIDGDTHNPPCDSIELSLRTAKGDDCATVIEGSDARPEYPALPNGLVYTYTLTRHNDGNGFDVQVTFNQDVNSVFFAQHFDGDAPSDCYSGWVENALARVNARTYTGSFSETDTYTRQKYGCDNAGSGNVTKPLFPLWPNLMVALKIVTTAGTHYTFSYPYNPEAPCNPIFAIYHYDDVPAADLRTTFAGGTVAREIYYYRHADPGEWEPLSLPFTVDNVSVYDSEDKAYYDLLPQRNSNPSNNAAGSTTKGNYWIRQQKTDVSSADFENSWYDDNKTLPQKNIAYNFRVPTAGGYYQNKFIIFHGVANQNIPSSFTQGTPPTGDDKFRLFGNNTMQTQTLSKAYKEDADGEYYRIANNWTLYPFECYVLATANTMQHMPIIGRWDVTDESMGMDEIDTDRIMSEIRVYGCLGQYLYSHQQCSLREVANRLRTTAGPGCYILAAPGAYTKIIIP